MRGFGDPSVQIQHNSYPTNGKSVFYQYDPQDPNPPDDYLLPWHLDTHTTSAQAIPSTSHAWTVQHQAINITVDNPTTAGNDMWLPAHLAADGATNGLGDHYIEQLDHRFPGGLRRRGPGTHSKFTESGQIAS